MKNRSNIFSIFFLAAFLLICVYISSASPSGGPVGGVGVVVHGSGDNGTSSCGNIDASCGVYPNCTDLTNVKYCVNGKVVESYCYVNSARNRTRTTACTGTVNIPLLFNVTDSQGRDENSEIEFFDSNNGTSVGTLSGSGEENFNASKESLDVNFNYDSGNFLFKIRKLNLTALASSPIHLSFDAVNPEIPNYTLVRAYKVDLPENFHFESIKLFVKFLPDEVVNASMLSLLKCDDYNISEEQCTGSWYTVASTLDQTGGKMTADITGFSAYALAESNATVSQSTQTQNTSNTSANSNQTVSTASPSVSQIVSNPQPAAPAAPVQPPAPSTSNPVPNQTKEQPANESQPDANQTALTESTNKPEKSTGQLVLPDKSYIAAMAVGIPMIAGIAYALKSRGPIGRADGNGERVSARRPQRLKRVTRGKTTVLVLQ
jgi:hypothetical protein